MARKANPNSKRQIQLREKEERRKRKEAEQAAKEALRQAEQLQAQLEEKQALEEQLAQLQAEKEQRLQEQAKREKQLAEEQAQKEEASQEQAIEPPKEEPTIEEPEEVQANHDQDDEDLLAQLAKATAPKKVKQETIQEEEPEAEELTAQDDLDGDFEEDFSDDFEPVAYVSKKEEAKQTFHDSEKENKVRFTVDEGKMSDILVNGLDSMFTMICPTSFKKAAFSKEELARMRRINHEFTNGDEGPTLDDEDLELMERYQEFEKYLEGLPLTDVEKDDLKAPLKVMLKDKGGDIPPGWALVFAAFTISLPRLSPIVMMKVAKFMAKQFESKTEAE